VDLEQDQTDELFAGLESSLNGFSKPPVQRLSYSHEALIDLIVQNPFADGLWLSAKTGYTRCWLSTIMASDAFQAKLAERRAEVINPALRTTLEEQARGLFSRSMEVLRAKFDQPPSTIPDALALGMFNSSAKALGYGARPQPEKPPDDVAAQLVKHADNLVSLLRREKSKVIDAEDADEGPETPQITQSS
jgi:hypothetical protein